ncbi:MAG: hypothetical protein K2N38_07425 [Oscillospiraceae bacterium]|nr:hypothetical protein [Oscillospiraceae bacterium]
MADIISDVRETPADEENPQRLGFVPAVEDLTKYAGVSRMSDIIYSISG